jgi:hypothetical protein
MTMIRLDHVSTKDHEVGDGEIRRALEAMDRMRGELRRGVAAATDEQSDPRHALGLSLAVEESGLSKHPDRILRHLGRKHDTFDVVSFSSCSLDFADPTAKDPAIAPACRGGAEPILHEAMKGVTWLMKDQLPDRKVRIPDFWLAASPTCSPLISGTECTIGGPLPHFCCLRVGTTDRGGVFVGISVYSGHCWVDRMTAIDGLRAVAALDEWRGSVA